MRRYDVSHKTGSTQYIITPPEEDRATAIGNMHKHFGEDRTRSSEDMIVDRQTHTHTHTDTQTDTLITILASRLTQAEQRRNFNSKQTSLPQPQNTLKLDARQSRSVAHPAIPLAACSSLLSGQSIGSPGFSAALALLVVSRRTRTQSCGLNEQKVIYRGTPRLVVGVLVWSTRLVDGRPRVLHPRLVKT